MRIQRIRTVAPGNLMADLHVHLPRGKADWISVTVAGKKIAKDDGPGTGRRLFTELDFVVPPQVDE